MSEYLNHFYRSVNNAEKFIEDGFYQRSEDVETYFAYSRDFSYAEDLPMVIKFFDEYEKNGGSHDDLLAIMDICRIFFDAGYEAALDKEVDT